MRIRRGYQGNVLLIELIVVVLFFALSAAISMGVFAKARLMTEEAALVTQAGERLSAWAEALAAEPDAAACLAQAGFTQEGDAWRCAQGRILYQAALTQQETAGGLRTRVELSALAPDGTALAALTAGGYFPGGEQP